MGDRRPLRLLSLGLLLILLAGAIAVACGGRFDPATVVGEGTVDAGAPDTPNPPTPADACGTYFTSYVARCEYPGLVATSLPRLQERWETFCTSLMALPGVNTAALPPCVAALADWPCNGPAPWEPIPPACAPLGLGTEPPGAACLQGWQCESGECVIVETDAGVPSSCGHCTQALQIGQSCTNALHNDSFCTAGSWCAPSPETGSTTGSSTCQPFDAGPPPATPTSLPPGAICGLGAEGPLCEPGLFCGGDLRCVRPVFGAPGEPCDPVTSPCLVATCDAPPGDAGAPLSGTCPTVIPDGEPCDVESATTTCDAFASCVDGVCSLATSTSKCP